MTPKKFDNRQFQYESDAWKRSLAFLLEENLILKHRLAELIRENRMLSDLLDVAEEYQNRFIRNDEIINLMRLDIAGFDKLLIKDIYEDGSLMKGLIRKQKKLRREFKMLEVAFNELKTQFNHLATSL